MLRYGFDSPTIWAHETTIFLCAMAFTYGGLYCSARNSHIRVVLLYDLAKGRTKRVLDAIISVICLIASAFFAWAAWTMVQKSIFRPDGSIHLETSGSAWDPPFPRLSQDVPLRRSMPDDAAIPHSGDQLPARQSPR